MWKSTDWSKIGIGEFPLLEKPSQEGRTSLD